MDSPMAWQSILGASALILSVVNGLMLFRGYIRDKPMLRVEPIHPEVYQWYFIFPPRNYNGELTRKYGFLAYISVINKGLRDVQLESWHLHIKTVGRKWEELKPLSITEPQMQLGGTDNFKYWPVMGTKSTLFSGDTLIKSGSSIAGFAYYVIEFYGDEKWNPAIENERVVGKLIVQSVYGNKAKAKFSFKEIPLESVLEIVPNIDRVDEQVWDISPRPP